jgi:hypothetical protein
MWKAAVFAGFLSRYSSHGIGYVDHEEYPECG